jgi:creatinine amidohydrolase/Fe(II)-dependent formamide hydrolase-like protein
VEEERVRKRGASTVDGSRMGTSHNAHADHGKKMYAQMIKKLYSEIKQYQHMQIANRT